MLEPETLIHDRYRIVGLVGQGAMGAVYEAIDQRIGRTVALKQTLTADAAAMDALEREAIILAGLQHSALPSVSDTFSGAHGQFLAMSFVPGPNLADLLEQRGDPFLPSVVLDWADQILDALIYLHSQTPPVLHRDIKPQNLKLTAGGHVVLLDFGLARGVVFQTRQAGQRSVVGYTLPYAPIEQVRGQDTDPRSDLFALASTLYHLLTGAPPPDALERAASHVAGQPDPLLPLRICCPDLPRPAADALDCCLSLDPVERITSAEELRRQLHLTKPIMRRPLRRRTPASSLDYLRTPLLALIVMIVLGGVVFLARPGESVSDHVQALIPTMQDTPISGIVTRVPTDTPLPVPSYNGMTPTLGPDVLISQTAPLTNMRLRPAPYLGDLGLELECIGDQHAINHAIASNQDFIALNCPSGLQIFRVSNGQAILNFTRPANAFAFNPHEPMLVTSFDGSAVDYWDLLNGQRLGISMMVEHATITTLDLSPDGQILVVLDAQGRMSFANRNTGDIPIDLRDNAEIAYSTTAFAPDGHYFAAGSRAGEVYVWERIGTKYQMLMIYDSAGLGEAVSMAFNADETLLIVGFREGVQGYVLGDVTDGKQLTGGSWHNPQVVIDPTSGMIAIGDDSGKLEVFQDCNPPLLKVHLPNASAIYGLAFLDNGTQLASRTEQGAQVWKVADQSAR